MTIRNRTKIHSVLQRRLGATYKRGKASKEDVVGQRTIKEVYEATDDFFGSLRVLLEDYNVFRKRFVKKSGEQVIKDLLVIKKALSQNRYFLQWLIDQIPAPVQKNTMTRVSILWDGAKFDEARDMAEILGIDIDDFFSRKAYKPKNKVKIIAPKGELDLLKRGTNEVVFHQGKDIVYYQNEDEFGEVAFSKDYVLAGQKWNSKFLFHCILIDNPEGIEIDYDNDKPKIGQIIPTIHGLAQIKKIRRRLFKTKKKLKPSQTQRYKDTRAKEVKRRRNVRERERQKAVRKKEKEKEHKEILRLRKIERERQKKNKNRPVKVVPKKKTLLDIPDPETGIPMSLDAIVKLRKKRTPFGVWHLDK